MGRLDDLDGSELCLVFWEAGIAGNKAGQVNMALGGWFSSVHVGDIGPWEG